LAIIFLDSLDHIQTSDLRMKYNKIVFGNYGQPTVTTDAGFTGQGLRCYANSGVFASVQNSATVIAGFLFRPSTLQKSNINASFLKLGNAMYSQVYLALTPSGVIRIYNGGGSLLGQSINTLTEGTWAHIEFKVTVSAVAGSCELRVNGKLEFSGSSLITQITNNAWVDTLGLYNDGGAVSFTPIWDYDSIYLIETTSGRFTDFIGPVDIGALLVNGDGAVNQTQYTQATNYQSVDGQYPNLDVEYLLYDTGQLSLFNFQDLLSSKGAIFAVAMRGSMRKRKGGVRQMQMVARPGTADGAPGSINYPYSALNYMTETPLYHSVIYESNPGYGGTWTVAGVNLLQGVAQRIS
jgi:hypothetical protein